MLVTICVAPAAADDAGICMNAKGDEAIAACTRAIASGTLADLARSRAHNWRGFHFKNDKADSVRALMDYDEAIRLDPRSASAHDNRAVIYIERADYDRAIADLNQAIVLNPQYALAYNNRSWAYVDRGDYDRAIADANLAISLNPKMAEAYLNRGAAYRGKGDYDRAIADFTQVISLNPQLARGYNDRGAAYGNKGDYDRAIADLDQAISLNPKDLTAYHNRGHAYFEKRDLDRALQDFDRAVHIGPIGPRLAKTLGARARAREEKGDVDGAYRDLDQAMGLDPSIAADARAQAMRARLQAALAKQAPKAAPPPIPPVVVATPTIPAAPAPFSPPVIRLSERRVALVIGNSGYRAAPVLANPRRDADAVASALRSIGFQTVQLQADIGRDRMADTLRSFAREADNADWALVYYAGHGIEMSGINYLIPVDAKLEIDRDVEFEAIPLDRVMSAVEGARKLRLVLLDACRDNPFAAHMRRTLASRSVGRGLASVEPATGTLVVYAAKHGETALDGDGTNSPFAAAFVKELQTPGLEVRRMFDFVRDDVMQATNNRQQPFSYGSLPGRQDFYFVAAK